MRSTSYLRSKVGENVSVIAIVLVRKGDSNPHGIATVSPSSCVDKLVALPAELVRQRQSHAAGLVLIWKTDREPSNIVVT